MPGYASIFHPEKAQCLPIILEPAILLRHSTLTSLGGCLLCLNGPGLQPPLMPFLPSPTNVTLSLNWVQFWMQFHHVVDDLGLGMAIICMVCPDAALGQKLGRVVGDKGLPPQLCSNLRMLGLIILRVILERPFYNTSCPCKLCLGWPIFLRASKSSTAFFKLSFLE